MPSKKTDANSPTPTIIIAKMSDEKTSGKIIDNSRPMITALQIIGGKNARKGNPFIVIFLSKYVSTAAMSVASEPKTTSTTPSCDMLIPIKFDKRQPAKRPGTAENENNGKIVSASEILNSNPKLPNEIAPRQSVKTV